MEDRGNWSWILILTASRVCSVVICAIGSEDVDDTVNGADARRGVGEC